MNKLSESSPIDQLRTIMQQLRDPDTGCEWDVRQDFSTIAAFTMEELKASWEAIKATERLEKHARKGDELASAAADDTPQSTLDGIAGNLPALKRADKIQTRAARVGFDWPDIQPVWGKLTEEIDEVHEALASGDAEAVTDEVGDLLFTVVNLARHAGVDSELALRQASAKFEKRFRRVEVLANGAQTPMDRLELEQLDVLWEQAKGVAD